MSSISNISHWVNAARAGEESAWETLYQHYYPSLYAAALQVCQSIPFAEDMVQETFTTAFLKVSQLREPEAFGGWLKKILLHHCWKAIEKETHQPVGKELPDEAEGWWENDWNQKFETLSNRARIYSCLAPLSDSLRSAILLRYFSDHSSYADIASVLAIPVGTVRSRLNEARRLLARQWSRTEDAHPGIWKKSEEWNHFYQQSFEGMHRHDDCKNKFLNHLEKNVVLNLPGGKTSLGRNVFDEIIQDDRRAGSWLTPTNIVSNDNISIVEVAHFNSRENPTHCPVRSVMILFRQQRLASKVGIHFSWQ